MDYLIINNLEIPTLVAISAEDQKNGLMGIKNPPIMIFIHNKAKNINMWMKDTPAPLDILFCNNNIVTDIKHGVPFSLDKIGSSQLSNMIVEMPKGLSDKLNIKIGSKIKIKYSLITLAKVFETKLEVLGITLS